MNRFVRYALLTLLIVITGFLMGIPRSCDCVSALAQVAFAAEANSKPAMKTPDKIIVYYFRGTSRCVSCRKIEALTDEAIHKNLSKEIESGLIEWKPINVETRDTRHFIDEYQLYTKSVIVSQIRNGKESKWKNLDKVWKLLGDEDGFKKYVTDEVAAYVAELKKPLRKPTKGRTPK